SAPCPSARRRPAPTGSPDEERLPSTCASLLARGKATSLGPTLRLLNRGDARAFAAAQRPAARVAQVIVVDARPHALAEQVEDQLVDAERRRDVEPRAREAGGRLGGEARDVLRPVLARAEEERADDDALRPALDAPRV